MLQGREGGIGIAIAIGLASSGADVAISARTVSELNETANEITKQGRKALVVPADLSDISQVKSIPATVVNEFGEIDILFCSAGMSIVSPAIEATVRDWDTMMAVNLISQFFLTQAVGKIMIEKALRGSIIFTTSEVADLAENDVGAYCPSKGGLKMVAKVLASEWGRYGIRVNCLAPCFINTRINEPLFHGATEGLRDFYDGKLKRAPLGGPGESEDLVGATVFLASDSASFVSGTTILCDGGYTAH
ncbi:MAG: SDR family NAD(P)-dependent oxidoreductase [Bacillota bacterium]